MRKRLWMIGLIVVFCGLPLLLARGAAQRFGWIACYTIADLERFPETRFQLPDATVLAYRTIDGPTSVGYPWFDTLLWELQSPQDAAAVVQTYRDYLREQGWRMTVDNPPLQVSWRKDRLRMELSIRSPDQLRPQPRPTDGRATTVYVVRFMESDNGPCPAVPPALGE